MNPKFALALRLGSFIAFALIAAANGAYTIDACHAGNQASNINSGHETTMAPSHQKAPAAGKGL